MTKHISAEVQQRAKRLIEKLSLEEKIWLMHGEPTFAKGLKSLLEEDSYHNKPFVAGSLPGHGLRGIRFIDGPRGVVINGGATMFPVPMARGASFDVDLERRIGQAIGLEHRALGGNLFGGVCINLLRHPAWGRAQETYGEDSVLLGSMGAALTEGVQENVMACVKHFALNSIENARFKVDVRVSKRALHEVYLPHFKQVVDAGVASVMSAYNSMDGEWCGQNKVLLRDILKEDWGFQGFVITDFLFGMRDARLAALAGQDIEMPFQMHYARFLKQLVLKEKVPESLIDEAATRIVEQQLSYQHIAVPPKSVLACELHTNLARKAARRSFVLLKNEKKDTCSVLPLKPDQRIAVIGQLANQANLGDHGSSDGRPDYVITPLDGILAAVKNTESVSFHDGENHDSAAQLAGKSDAAVVVVGYTFEEEGEYIAPISMEPFADGIAAPWFIEPILKLKLFRGLWRRVIGFVSKKLSERVMSKEDATFGRGGDRKSLTLPAHHEELIRAVAKSNNNTVVLVMSGSAVTMSSWEDKVAAIMMVWYPGMEGGNAIADVLFGDYSPSGRLPFVIPKSESDLPSFDPEATEIKYGLWHGYKKLARDNKKAAYPFGFGLSYGDFELNSLTLSSDSLKSADAIEKTLNLKFTVTNLSELQASHVWQLYSAPPNTDTPKAPRSLIEFGVVDLLPKETKKVAVKLSLKRLAIFSEQENCFHIERGEYELFLADHSEANPLSSVTLSIE